MSGEFGTVEHILEQLGLDTRQGRPGGVPSTRSAPSISVSGHGKAHPSPKYLELPVGRRGVELTAEECLLLCSALEQVRKFATTGGNVSVANQFGRLQTTSIRGVHVLECACSASDAPLRMTKEKVALVLVYEREISAFARRRA